MDIMKSTLDFHKVEYNLATILAFYAYSSHHKDKENCNKLLEKLKRYNTLE